MKIYADIYKSTGKWYQQIVIRSEKEYSLESIEYKKLLNERILSYHQYQCYIVITDDKNNKLFHQKLYDSLAIRRIRLEIK